MTEKNIDTNDLACYDEHRQSSIEPSEKHDDEIIPNIIDSGPIHVTRMWMVRPLSNS